MNVSVWGYVHAGAAAATPKIPATGIIGDCVLPNIDAANWTQLNSGTARADDALSRRAVSPAPPVSFLCTQPQQLQTCSPHFSGTLENPLLQLPINVSSAPLENKCLQDRVSIQLIPPPIPNRTEELKEWFHENTILEPFNDLSNILTMHQLYF